MKKRYLFAEVNNFWFYDCSDSFGNINENVFAFTNSYGNEKAFVLYNNRFERAEGKIFLSTPKLTSEGNNKKLTKLTLISALKIRNDENIFYICFDEISKQNFIYDYHDFANGFQVSLNGFEHRVFLGFTEVYDSDGIFRKLHEKYYHIGIDDIEHEINEIRFEPVYNAFDSIFNDDDLSSLTKCIVTDTKVEECKAFEKLTNKIYYLCNLINSFPDYRVDSNKIVNDFKSQLNTIKLLNSYFNSIQVTEDPSQENNYKSLLVSHYSNYKENIFILILMNLYNFFSLEKSRNKFEFSFERILHSSLMKLGRGKVGVERESKLIVALHEFINLSVNYKELISLSLPTEKLLKSIEKTLLKLLSFDDLKDFLLVNTYKGITYYSKERFEEFIDWMTTLLLIGINENVSDEEVENNLEKRISLINAININLKSKSDASGYDLSKLIKLMNMEN
ncbi:MAG: hypothetical protein Fur0015_13700 [Ignavibacteriales bacterium]